jgi:hypothetical protein
MIASLLFLAMFFGMVVVLPILVLSLVFRVALGLLLLPFHILGAVVKVFAGLAGGVLRLFFGAAGLLTFGAAALFFLVFLPLLPLFIIVGGIWLVARAFRPARAARVVSY